MNILELTPGTGSLLGKIDNYGSGLFGRIIVFFCHMNILELTPL